MWTYQQTDELYHHGVLGMKWGIRRYQEKRNEKKKKAEEHSRKVMGSNRYSYHKKYHGDGRVKRMTKSIDSGKTYKEALYKEQHRLAKIRTAKALAVIGGITLGYMDIITDGHIHKSAISGTKQLISKGKKFVDSKAKSLIIDSNGKVVKRYFFSSLGSTVADNVIFIK